MKKKNYNMNCCLCCFISFSFRFMTKKHILLHAAKTTGRMRRTLYWVSYLSAVLQMNAWSSGIRLLAHLMKDGLLKHDM